MSEQRRTNLNDEIHRVNVHVNEAEQQRQLGLHTVADVYCNKCENLLGWKFVWYKKSHASDLLNSIDEQKYLTCCSFFPLFRLRYLKRIQWQQKTWLCCKCEITMLQTHAFTLIEYLKILFLISFYRGKLQERNGNQIEEAVEPITNTATGNRQ